MVWTAIIKSGRKTETLHFSGPHGYRETYNKLALAGYKVIALVKGTHPVALKGGEESQSKTIGHI